MPNSYIMMSDSNTQTPNQREEIKAYRDDYTRDLHRATATGHKTKMSFQFRALKDTELLALQRVMRNSLVSENERKYNVEYWNDEEMAYKTSDFYIPDITYTRSMVDEDNNILYYAPFTMTLVEY